MYDSQRTIRDQSDSDVAKRDGAVEKREREESPYQNYNGFDPNKDYSRQGKDRGGGGAPAFKKDNTQQDYEKWNKFNDWRNKNRKSGPPGPTSGSHSSSAAPYSQQSSYNKSYSNMSRNNEKYSGPPHH